MFMMMYNYFNEKTEVQIMKKILAIALALSVLTGLTETAAIASADETLTILSGNETSMGITPNPIISRNVPAYSEKSTNPQQGNDDYYYTSWNASAPDYLAYDLSSVPENDRTKVIAVWYNSSTFDNIGQYVSRSAEPIDYVIEVNPADGGEYPETGWETVKTVTDNVLCSRQCIIDMEGYNWIRLRVTKSMGDQISLNFDIHSAPNGASDSWLFLGDSITAGGMVISYGTTYGANLNSIDSRYNPVQENGGIGGISSYHGCEAIDGWLSDSSANYVSIAYGTNDSWGNQSGTDRYYTSTKYMIDAILSAGKIPVLPTIPYSTNPDVNSYLDSYNDVVRRLYDEYGDKLVHGPDFEQFFRENPDLLSSDGVHPSFDGYEAMRKFWAETMYETVYTAENISVESIRGDVNADKAFNSADLITMQKWFISNGELSDWKAGDLCEDGAINIFDLVVMRRELTSLTD